MRYDEHDNSMFCLNVIIVIEPNITKHTYFMYLKYK